MSNRALPAHLNRFLFSDAFEPWNDWFADNTLSRGMTIPKANISETDTSYNLAVAAPGLHKKDFKIDLQGNTLTVSAESEQNKESKDEKMSRQEYNYSSFSRSFTLPEEVQQDKIEATYDGGILKLVLPKTDKAAKQKNKTIEIK
jgi:HSP20 family protein